MSLVAANRQKTLLVVCAASAGWAFSFGLGAPLASLWLRDAGCSPTVLGLNTAVYYLGVALTSLILPRLMRYSAKDCVVAGMIIDAATTALFPWTDSVVGWFVLRALGGVGTALSLIPTETLVNQNAPPEHRARDFGFYAFAVALGIALGPMVGLPLYPYAPRLAFAIGGFVTLLAAGLTLWGFPSVGLVEEESSEKPRLRGQFLAFGTAWVQGFLEGGMITFLPVYLLEIGYSEAAVSGLMGALFMGVLLFQVPAAWAADRLGRLYLVLACHAVVLWGLLALPGCTGALQLGLGLFLVGGCCAALYPLGLALLGERLPAAALGRANAWYLAINCAGSLTGPVLTGVALEWFGRSAFFGTTAAAVVLVVGGWALRRALSRKANSSSADFQASRRAA